MIHIDVTDRSGKERAITVAAGPSLMEALRDSGFDDGFALCGGCCSCATCHVYMDEALVERLPAMHDDERELLESSDHRAPTSRLSCQVPLTDDMDGMSIVIAPAD